MITIKIATIDRTSLLEWQSFQWQQNLTSQVDMISFALKKHAGQTYKPNLNERVELFEDATLVFSGNIVEIDEEVEAGRLETIHVRVKDNTHDMDKNLVIKIYENTDAEDIISDINTNFLPAGYDATTFVSAPINVNYISFNYEQPSKCFQQLAELIGYDWYVDENKKIHFFSQETNSAPFNLTDTNGKYYFNTLKIHKTITNLRNSIFVRGGEFRGTTFTETETADGVAKVFKQGFKYSNIGVKVNSVTKTVGIDNITDPSTVDVLYNFQEKALKFREDNKPANGQDVEVTGLPHIPVIIKVKDNTSISEFGEFQHKIIDKSINSKEGARDRAKQEIIQWANDLNEGQFETKETGLRVGQRINVQSTIRNINENFVITQVSSRLKSPTEMRHSVVMVSAKIFGMVEFLQKLLIQKDKEIVISKDEVLDKIETAFETVNAGEVFLAQIGQNVQTESTTLSETPTVQALNYPTVFVLAPFPVPTGFKRELALSGGVLA